MRTVLADRRFSIVWAVLRIWLGYQWLEAGLHKVSDPKWVQTGESIKGYWTRAVTTLQPRPTVTYDWYRAFLKGLLDGENHVWFGKLVAWGEVLVGIALMLGALTAFAALMGALMNLNFMLAGSSSTNPVLYTIAILLLVAGANAGAIGLDRYLLPQFARLLRRNRPAPANLP